jgi:hypothetical protein
MLVQALTTRLGPTAPHVLPVPMLPSSSAQGWSATAASPDAPPRRPFARCERRGGATGWRPLGAVHEKGTSRGFVARRAALTMGWDRQGPDVSLAPMLPRPKLKAGRPRLPRRTPRPVASLQRALGALGHGPCLSPRAAWAGSRADDEGSKRQGLEAEGPKVGDGLATSCGHPKKGNFGPFVAREPCGS